MRPSRQSWIKELDQESIAGSSKDELNLPSSYQKPKKRSVKPVLAIHGGAGTIARADTSPEKWEQYKAALRVALLQGYHVLKNGGEALDAAVAAVTSLEDCPLFNAGKGAVFNVAGKNELECSVMSTRPPVSHPEIPESRRGIGLMLLTHVRNPSKAARALYLRPSLAPHATLSGAAAEGIIRSLGEELVDPGYFFTEERWRQHRCGLGLPEESPSETSQVSPPLDKHSLDYLPKGTVGAVCLDVHGAIAVVTSTGGKTNKLVGRIGDTPSFAAGFWAEEWMPQGYIQSAWRRITGRGKIAVGISGTGDGDYFLRQATAVTVAARMKFKRESLEKASQAVIDSLKEEDADGGLIAVDDQGNVAMPLNCGGMYRGVIRSDGTPRVAIFHDDVLE